MVWFAQGRKWSRQPLCEALTNTGLAGRPKEYFEAIDHLVQLIVAHERAWQEYFSSNGIRPYSVVYEELVTYVEESVLDILRFLGIPLPDRIPDAAPRMKRQSDGVSDEWVARYLAIKGSR